jgi:hypothetical protein
LNKLLFPSTRKTKKEKPQKMEIDERKIVEDIALFGNFTRGWDTEEEREQGLQALNNFLQYIKKH